LSFEILFEKSAGVSNTGDIAFSANADEPVKAYNNSHIKNRFFIIIE
jgi:hypothetical protein